MSDYQAAARTNYFRPRNINTLRTALEEAGLSEVIELSQHGPAGMVMLYSQTDGGAWPTSTLPPEDTGEDGEDFDIADFLGTHVASDEIAVVMEVGFTGVSDLVGWAHAVNSEGRQVSINLDDIGDLALVVFGQRPRSVFA